MRKRLIAVMVMTAFVLTAIGARVYTLTRGELQEVSEQQSTRREVIAVSRGTVYDRYLQPFVNRSGRITASVAPFSECVALMGSTLRGTYRQSVLNTLRQGERVNVMLDGWVPPTVGIIQITAPERYDHECLACHTVGYVDADNTGVSGIEKVYDELLSAYSGQASVSYPVDALGRASVIGADVLTNTLDRSAGGVALTLDREVQRIAQRAAVSYLKRGAVVVSDVRSGEVLASVSVPTYDPCDVESALAEKSSPLLDRTQCNYNLGSVFKIITAAAALEQGVSSQKRYTCNGFTQVDGICFYCHNPLGDGSLTMEEAMAKSCNCYFIQLALDIGASAVYDMAQRAGFAQALPLAGTMQTARAILPSRRDLSADAALANLAIGQGDLLATPYHVATLLTAVAADGVMTQPSLFYGTVDENGILSRNASHPQSLRLFSRKTATTLQRMLEKVVEEGTGESAGTAVGAAAGKTGTAETGWILAGEKVVQSWFAGYYPADKPQYVIAVLSENGGSDGITAAPLFATIAQELAYAGLVEK